MTRRVVVLCLSLVATACSSGSTPPKTSTGTADAARQLTTLADEYFAAFVDTFPIGARFSGVPGAPADRLGDNVRRFRDHVLENGSVPLALLRSQIERWVASEPR